MFFNAGLLLLCIVCAFLQCAISTFTEVKNLNTSSTTAARKRQKSAKQRENVNEKLL